MANNNNGNSFYVDSTGSFAGLKNVKVIGITLTATSANAQLVLQNADSGSSNRIDLRNPTSGSTVQFRFDQAPLAFPNGVKVSTITNGNATIIYTTTGG